VGCWVFQQMSKTVVLNTRAVKWTDYMTPVAMIMSNSYNSSVSLMVLVGIIAINFVEFAVVVLVYYYYKRNSTTAQTDN
jgi:hypothetical protein